MIDFKKKMEEDLMTKEEYRQPPKRRLGLKVSGFLLAFLILFSATVLISGDSSESWVGKVPIIGRLIGLVESSDKKIKGESQDRVNILLLGMGGKKHEGGYLTDTIILVSLKPSTKKIAMLSVPRDMMIAVEALGWRKINAINALAERSNPSSGGDAVSQAISDVLDIPIHYYLRVDFEGFINVINHLEGLDIYVDNTISDFSYPISGRENYDDYYARFEHLYIEKGWQKMDGEMALKYVRSRHSAGIEGSDFSRAKRQQKLIKAVKDKLFSAENLLKPNMISAIILELGEHVMFNLKIWEAIKIWQIFKDINNEDISNYVLDDSPSGLLVSSRSDAGAYILTPRGGNFDDIKYLVNNFFPEDFSKKAQVSTLGEKKIESKNYQLAKIEIKNGTWINGLASQTAVDLEKNNFEVLRISNSGKRDFRDSVVYDFTYGAKKEALKYLKESLSAEVFFDLPEWLAEEIKIESELGAKEIPDFLIILGGSASKNKF